MMTTTMTITDDSIIYIGEHISIPLHMSYLPIPFLLEGQEGHEERPLTEDILLVQAQLEPQSPPLLRGRIGQGNK